MRRAIGTFVLVVCIWLLGCGGSSPQYETIRGLQEENSVLKKQVAKLEDEANSTKKDLKRDHEDRMASAGELANRKISQLENEIAELRIKTATIERERLTLEAVQQSGPRVEKAHEKNLVYTVWALSAVLLIVLFLVTILLYRYRATRDRLRQLTMQTVAELRLQAEHDYGK